MFNFSPFNFWVLITFKKFSKPLLYIQLQSVTYVQSCTRLLLFGTFELVWGNGVPISGFPWPRREFLGTRKGLWKTLGIFWGQVGLQFWFFSVFIPKNPQKNSGNFGGGDNFYFVDFWGFPPNKLIFLGFPKIVLICKYWVLC